jgi:hypothetical protein
MKTNVASGLSRALKAHLDFIGDSAFDTAPSQQIGGKDGRVYKFETSGARQSQLAKMAT